MHGSGALPAFQIQVNKDKSKELNLQQIYKYLKELLGAINYTSSFILEEFCAGMDQKPQLKFFGSLPCANLALEVSADYAVPTK